MESVEFISVRFDEYKTDCKEKDEMIKSLDDEILGLTEKVDKLSSLVDGQKQYSGRNCILIHGVKENQNEDTDEVVVNKMKSEMDLEISPRDIDPSKDKNRPIIVKFVKCMDKRRIFTNKNRLKGKNMSVTESLTKIRMSALKEANRSCVTEKQELLFILMTLFYFHFFGGFFAKHFKTVSYFVFLILFTVILPLIKIILIKIQFFHFISLNITILLC